MSAEINDPIVGLYRESFPAFARMARRMGGGLEEVKDCFHDALLIYLEKEKAGKLRLHASPRAYLLGIAKICWLQRRRKEAMLSGLEEVAAGGLADQDSDERERTLLEYLQKSGRKCLELLQAFYYDNCSMDHIARKFGLKGRRSATVQKYKCLEKVRKEIKTMEVYAQ